VTIQKIALIGAGVMGLGIAQIAAQAGLEVRLFDAKENIAKEGFEKLKVTLEKLMHKGKITERQLIDTLSRLIIIDRVEGISGVDLVIEAVVENLAIKQSLFKQLEAIVKPDVILVSNTSSLLVSEIASVCKNKERIAGYHFFNPVPLMKIVEVVPGVETAEYVIEELLILAERMGHLGVKAKDSPGFIVNNIGRAFSTEGLKVLGEGVSTTSEIDRILRNGLGFKMGPFELFDLTALDVSHPAMISTFTQFFFDDRYRPSPITSLMFAGKKFGRKVGEGFYKYENGIKINEDPPQAVPKITQFNRVWIKTDYETDAEILKTYLLEQGILLDLEQEPNTDSLILLATYGEDTTTAALRFGVDPTRSINIDMLPEFTKHRTLMPSIATRKDYIDQAHAIFAKSKQGLSIIDESVGFVSQRILALIVNLASDVAQQQVASAMHVDTCVKLALGYPYGPISWGDILGAKRILLITQRIFSITGDQRYRPSVWLQRRANLNLSLLYSSNI
jgi:3-hydroxybutyryl-CoA dehydrogenase